MISFPINGVPVLFIRAFTADDTALICDFVHRAASNKASGTDVLFIDTPETSATVDAVSQLMGDGFQIFFRDHHEIENPPATQSDTHSIAITKKLRQILGERCIITKRSSHPACSTLVGVGEFKHSVAVIADPDADGLTAAMKAVGVYYEGLDEDAAKLDGEPSLQVTGTPLSALLAKNLAVLPQFDPRKPEYREKVQTDVFQNWVKAVQGEKHALEGLKAGVETYDQAVSNSRQIAAKAKMVAPGVVLADTTETELYDVGTLNSLLEQFENCKVTALRRARGPIAAIHGVQYTVAVAKAFQNSINLKFCLPSHFKTDLNEGIITNVSFLLHVSEDKWEQLVLPALRKL